MDFPRVISGDLNEAVHIVNKVRGREASKNTPFGQSIKIKIRERGRGRHVRQISGAIWN